MMVQYDTLRKVVEQRGYKWFDRGSYNLNIVGIRRYEAPNTFDDLICVAYRDGSGEKCFRSWPATTEPGRHYLTNPMNRNGTAVLAPGQYVGAYLIGRHRGKYAALVQDKPLPVYRDTNRNEVAETTPFKIDTGIFGINIHRASARGESGTVDKWGAGCQVFADPEHFAQFMNLIYAAKKHWGSRFTYTLITENKTTEIFF